MSRWRRWIKKRRKKFARHCPLFFSTLPAFLLSPNCYFGGEIDPTQINEIYNKSNNIQLKKRVSLMASLFHDQNLSWGACKTRDIRIKKNLYSFWHIIDCWIQGEGHMGLLTPGCSSSHNSLRGIAYQLMHPVQYFAQKLIGPFQ